MKLGYKIAIGVAGTLGVISLIQRFNNKPKIWYVDKFPVAGITIPPFGIIIKKTTMPENKQEPEFHLKATLIHETVHWKQFQKQGYLLFYLGYLFGFIKSGFSYLNNPYEQEAYLKTGRMSKVNPDGTHTNLAPKFYDDKNNNVYYYNVKNGIKKKIVVANIKKDTVDIKLPNGTQTKYLASFFEKH